MKQVNIILDTDIGTDVDDALALALALNSPEIELLVVSVVSTQVSLRAQLAAKILRVCGREEIPVAAGREDIFDGKPTCASPVNQAGVLREDDSSPPDNGIDGITELNTSGPEEQHRQCVCRIWQAELSLVPNAVLPQPTDQPAPVYLSSHP